MMKVFMITADALDDPVMIVARDSAEAFGIFHIWREVHAPEALKSDAEVLLLTEQDLATTPQLAKATDGGIGVAWWMGHRAGWVVGAPDDDALGLVAPPMATVRYFVFTGFEGTLAVHVFAETIERAIATLHLYSHDQSGYDADYEQVTETSPWLLTGAMVTLREGMFEGETGIGHECEDGFWRIFPADYDPPLRKRDGSLRE